MSSSLLTAAGAAPPSRSASAVVAKAARGFHVFRVDGYSVTTMLPAGERLTSQPFCVGGRCWFVDYYPNGADASGDSNAIGVYLRLQGTHIKQRVRAEYKFGLLDPAGAAAYELPADTGIFSSPVAAAGYGGVHLDGGDPGCGYAAFIGMEDLGRRRDILLKENSLAIRCDVAVGEISMLPLAVQRHDASMGRGRGRGRWGGGRGGYGGGGYESPDEYDVDEGGSRRRSQPPADDKEFIRQCLASQQRKY